MNENQGLPNNEIVLFVSEAALVVIVVVHYCCYYYSYLLTGREPIHWNVVHANGI